MIKKISEIILVLLICAICIGKIIAFKFDKSVNYNGVAVAQESVPRATEGANDPSTLNPEAMFRSMRLAYNEKLIVAASMREETLVHDQLFIGIGNYMEKIDNAKRYLRMEMSYSCDSIRYSVQYIADGAKDLFWIFKNVGSEKELCRVDLFSKLNAQNANPELVASIDNNIITPISLAGIPYMLFQINKNFNFTSCSIVHDEQTKIPYCVIVGAWKLERFPIQELVKDKVIDWNSVPADIPDTVKVYFGISDYFPYKIYYYRTFRGKQTLISKLNFYDVSFDVRLNPKQFGFEPPAEIIASDITNRYTIMKKENKPEKKTSSSF